MSLAPLLEHLCDEINRMGVSSRIHAIKLIVQTLDGSASCSVLPPRKRGRLSELEGIGMGTWDGIDVDRFIREERDSWES